jgi:hypothetical protein
MDNNERCTCACTIICDGKIPAAPISVIFLYIYHYDEIFVVKKSVTYIPYFTIYENPKQHGEKVRIMNHENTENEKPGSEKYRKQVRTGGHTFDTKPTIFCRFSVKCLPVQFVERTIFSVYKSSTTSISKDPKEIVPNLRPFCKNYFFQLMQVRVN